MKFAKHIHILHLLSQVPVRSFQQFEYGRRYTDSVMTVNEANDCWDHIFHYIFEHWAKPETAIADKAAIEFNARRTASEQTEIMDCGTMLQMNATEIVDRLASLPPYFSESVFPVAVARYLLRELSIPMNHRATLTFREFHNRYGTMVLEG